MCVVLDSRVVFIVICVLGFTGLIGLRDLGFRDIGSGSWLAYCSVLFYFLVVLIILRVVSFYLLFRTVTFVDCGVVVCADLIVVFCVGCVVSI